MFKHEWDVSIPEATRIQKEMRSLVRLEPLPHAPHTIAGADISFNRYSDIFHAGIVVLSLPDLVIIDRSFHTMQVKFPYVPGYLSFREVPAIMEAYARLKIKPDVLMMDGNGIAHPRRLGVATHLGILLDIPVIGVAKSLLYGVGEEPAQEKGSISYLTARDNGETIGAYLRTKDRVKPVIVSPGHRITLPESIALSLACVRNHRIPEPTRLAHNTVNEFRRGEIEG
ncbi:MAG: endonuclease [Candidatus Kaiserbacteria bacterium]|nr:endonuclease [Candidatus Kaiserbacteria bacterium]